MTKIIEAADDEALRMAADMTEAMNQRLDSIMRKNIETGFLLGANQAHQIFRIEPTFDLLDNQAVEWMNNRAANMVTKINDETRQRLAETLSRGARAGDSTATLARRIRTEVNAMADISKGRAHLIANTELNNAMSEASLQTYTRLQIAGKSWSTVGDDLVSDDCLDNESAGVIPIDGTFPGGVPRPPQHPGCRCTLVPERMGADEQQPFVTDPTAPPTVPAGPKIKTEKDLATTNAWSQKNVKYTPGNQTGEGVVNSISNYVPAKDLRTVTRVDVLDGTIFTPGFKPVHPGQAIAGQFNKGTNIIEIAAKQTVDANVVVHEFGHGVMNSWRGGGSTLKVEKAFAKSKQKGLGFVSEYAKTNVDEYFAEAYRAYHVNPEILFAKNQPMYKLIDARYK